MKNSKHQFIERIEILNLWLNKSLYLSRLLCIYNLLICSFASLSHLKIKKIQMNKSRFLSGQDMTELTKNKHNALKERDASLDFAKGILIVLVVLGHAPGFQQSFIIYWFHMPAFFFISGLLWRGNELKFLPLLLKFKYILIPYICFGLLLSLYTFLQTSNALNIWAIRYLQDSIINFLSGGRFAKGIFGFFWFINVLLIINLIMFFLIKLKDYIVISLIIISYFGAHILSRMYGNYPPNVYWGLDSVLYSIVFFYLGFKFKPYSFFFKKTVVGIISIFLCSMFILLQIYGFISFRLDIKYLHLTNIVLDLIIPVVFIAAISFISSAVSRYPISRPMVFLGKNTLIIMYLHIVSNSIITSLLKYSYHYSIFVMAGITVPLLAVMLINLSPISRKIFSGH